MPITIRGTKNMPRTSDYSVPRHGYQWKLSFSIKTGLFPCDKVGRAKTLKNQHSNR